MSNIQGPNNLLSKTQGPNNLTGWQGEIQGGLAAGGKISLGPFNMLLRAHSIKQIPTNAAKRVESEPDKVFTDISYGLKKYGNMSKTDIFKLKTSKPVLPSLKITNNRTEEEELLSLTKNGLKHRFEKFILKK